MMATKATFGIYGVTDEAKAVQIIERANAEVKSRAKCTGSFEEHHQDAGLGAYAVGHQCELPAGHDGPCRDGLKRGYWR